MALYSIKAASMESGVSAHTIRAWERRYGALDPERSTTNRRGYSKTDIERLQLLHTAVRNGHSIGRIANLSDDALRSITPRMPTSTTVVASDDSGWIERCYQSVRRLDDHGLESDLNHGSAQMGIGKFVDSVLSPLLTRLGEGWESGEVSVAMEHAASAVIRSFLHRTLRSLPPSAQAAPVVVTTPAGQVHELGALMAAVHIALEGYRAIYLGPDTPAADIADSVRRLGAAGVALSIVHPLHDDRIGDELKRLRAELPDRISVWVGGSGAQAYDRAIRDSGCLTVRSFGDLREMLRRIG